MEGLPPRGESWTVDVEHPQRRQPAAVLGLRGGAVATSTRARRVWGPSAAGRRLHHLIDPSTGRPSESGLLSATVVAARGWQAEVLAKGAFVAGLQEGLALLRETGTAGVLIDDGGAVHRSTGLHAFTGPLIISVPEPLGVGGPAAGVRGRP